MLGNGVRVPCPASHTRQQGGLVALLSWGVDFPEELGLGFPLAHLAGDHRGLCSEPSWCKVTRFPPGHQPLARLQAPLPRLMG